MADAVQGMRAKETGRAALVSVVSNSMLTLCKLAVGFLTGSVSVVSEGVHSANDLLAALMAFFSVRKANQPADGQHVYGHGKFEALSGAAEALLILGAALVILYTAVRRLISGEFEGIDLGPGLAVMALSIVTNIAVSRYLYRVATRHDSIALRADAAHLTADVWTSAAVFAGLLGMWVANLLGREAHWLDPGLAVVVAGLVLMQGARVARTAFDQLVDRSLPEEEIERIVQALLDHREHFVGFHRLRSRKAGGERHVDLHLVVCDGETVAQAHALADHLEKEVAALFPRAHVMIHVEPCRDEQCRARKADGTWADCPRRIHPLSPVSQAEVPLPQLGPGDGSSLRPPRQGGDPKHARSA